MLVQGFTTTAELPVITRRFCINCGRYKMLKSFGRHSATNDGLHTYCSECNYARNQAWVRANREKRRASARAYYHRRKAKLEEQARPSL
jgi:hypothetical protein